MSQRTRRLARQAEQLHVADMSEDQYQAWIEERAAERGWIQQFHVRRAQVKGRWVTNTSSPGVPDLWLLRPTTGQLLVLEVKAQDGTASPDQRRWIAGLQRVPGVEAYIVRPSDAEHVLAKLARPAAQV
jgi:hypothetical protein